MRVLVAVIVSCLPAVSAGIPVAPGANWGGKYSPCDRHSELLEKGHLSLGVRLWTSNPRLAAELARALDFWATVLDLEWRQDNSRSCAVEIVDGRSDLFIKGQVARAQLPDRPAFRGWIAFNPHISLTGNEMFFAAVHELGHLLGLPHNSSAESVMYYLQLDGPLVLNRADLEELAARHKVRINRLDRPVSVAAPVLTAGVNHALAGCASCAERSPPIW